MFNDNNILGIDEQILKQAVEAYSLIEPLLGDYLSPRQKREHRQVVCEELNISQRTLRRKVNKLKKNGNMLSLVRKQRTDKGENRNFSEKVLAEAKDLLKENPYRSVNEVLGMIRDNPNEELSRSAKKISASNLYHRLVDSGHSFKKQRNQADKVYHSFEAEYANKMWQGDARHGVLLPDPINHKKKKRTYLFGWIDDFSRKLLHARYYWDEQLPRLEDSFRNAILRWGLPTSMYCDNGSVYISGHFTAVVTQLGCKKIHHKAYSAWCKGKIEMMMKRLKKFQKEAECAGFKTLEELNAALEAWIEVEYNEKVHSATGETPNFRFRKSLEKHPNKRITDLDAFNELFFWNDERVVDKYGCIKMYKNKYRINKIKPGERVELRFDPFDLSIIKVLYKKKFSQFSKAGILTTPKIKNIPEEKDHKPAKISQASRRYFELLRDKHLRLKAEKDINPHYLKIKEQGDKNDQ